MQDRCVAGSRLIVHESIAEHLLVKLQVRANKVMPCVTWDSEARFSPLIHAMHADKVDSMVKHAIKQGASLLQGGKLFEDTTGGAYYQPTILSQVTGNMDVQQKEAFGPVQTLQTFREDEEAVAMANDTDYGLAAGVYSRDIAQALRAMRRINAGTVWINRYGRSRDFNIPTGGFKTSGIGKDLGIAAF